MIILVDKFMIAVIFLSYKTDTFVYVELNGQRKFLNIRLLLTIMQIY